CAVTSSDYSSAVVRPGLGGASAPATVGGLAALAARCGGQIAILGEAALFIGNAGAAFACNLTPTFDIHCGEATLGGGAVGLVSKHVSTPSSTGGEAAP